MKTARFSGFPMAAAAAGLITGACAVNGAPPPSASLAPPPVVGTGPAPAPIPNYDWFLNQDDPVDVSLLYGLDESDDVPLSLSCRRGEGRVELIQDAPVGAPPEIYLESGGETQRFAATGEPSELSDGLFMTGHARSDEPVLQRFRSTGWLAVWQGGMRKPYAAHPGSEERIESFFAACG